MKFRIITKTSSLTLETAYYPQVKRSFFSGWKYIRTYGEPDEIDWASDFRLETREKAIARINAYIEKWFESKLQKLKNKRDRIESRLNEFN